MRLTHKVRLVTRGMTRVDPEAKRALLVMANAWLMLAVQRSKNIEYAPATSDPPHQSTSRHSAKPDDPLHC
jgi:hypothetical protein